MSTDLIEITVGTARVVIQPAVMMESGHGHRKPVWKQKDLDEAVAQVKAAIAASEGMEL